MSISHPTPAELADEAYQGFLDTGVRPAAAAVPAVPTVRGDAFALASKAGESMACIGDRWLRVLVATHKAVLP